VANGTDIDDVVRLNVFYTGVGSRGDWSEEAGSRASHFTEPGPVATGVPVLLLPKKDAQVLVRVIAVKGARENMQREYGWPDKHWDWPYHMPYKHGCNCAGTVFVGGQVALTPDAEVMDPGDLEAQTRTSIDYILSVLNEFALDEDGLLRLTAFFQYQNHESPGIVARAVKDALGGREVPLLLVALPELSYENMVVEIEAEAR